MTALYEAMMVDCIIMNKIRTLDELGGWTTKWEDGPSFKAAILKDNTIEARLAEKEGYSEVYTITVQRETPLEFHDVFRRVEDGQVFRVTSNVKDNTSPRFSGINFGQCLAERWVLE